MDRCCECGCGQKTWIATVNNAKLGYVSGQPVRFIRGHNNRKTPGISYSAAHKYLSRNYAKTGLCDKCGIRGSTEYALVHGHHHSHNREDYSELCVPCHREYDTGGERASNAKLTEQGVRDIRARRASGEKLLPLALEYDVTIQAISMIARRVNWKGVT